MTTKPLRPAATPGRLPRRKRRLASFRLAQSIPVVLAVVGAVAIVLLVLGLLGVHAVTAHIRLH
jgi:hypothetical protein